MIETLQPRIVTVTGARFVMGRCHIEPMQPCGPKRKYATEADAAEADRKNKQAWRRSPAGRKAYAKRQIGMYLEKIAAQRKMMHGLKRDGREYECRADLVAKWKEKIEQWTLRMERNATIP
jgi:anti-sigma28 factor (negative regulator of flagellin synthesis)